MVAASEPALLLVVLARTISAAPIAIARQVEPAPAMARLTHTAAATFALPGTAGAIRIAAPMDSVLPQASGQSSATTATRRRTPVSTMTNARLVGILLGNQGVCILALPGTGN